MSQREVDRAGVIAEVAAGRMRQRRATEVLGRSQTELWKTRAQRHTIHRAAAGARTWAS